MATPPVTCERKTLIERHNACKRRGEHVFYAALTHAIRDCHCDPYGHDQWLLALVLSTVLAYQFFHRWEVVLLIFIVLYVTNIAFFMLMRRATRSTTASVTNCHTLASELLTDPLLFAFTLFVAWYVIDHTVVGWHAHGPTEWWRATLVVGVSLFSGHSYLYWWVLIALLLTIWATHLFCVATTHSVHLHEKSLAISASATIISCFVFIGFVRPICHHFMQNALWVLFFALFFSSAIQFILFQ
jgi:hypothetical protein